MTEELENAVEPEQAALSKDQLMAKMQTAMESGDFKEVAKIAKEIDKAAKLEEKAELEAQQAAVAAVTEDVAKAITKTIQKFIDDGKLDAADGVWYAWDFEETLKTCKLMKRAIKASGGTHKGVGKKYDISTDDLLEKFGEAVAPDIKLSGDDVGGRTWKELWENYPDKNSRYKIRTHLIKLNQA